MAVTASTEKPKIPLRATFNLLQNLTHMVLNLGICGDQHVETIFLGELEVFWCVQSSLEEQTIRDSEQ